MKNKESIDTKVKLSDVTFGQYLEHTKRFMKIFRMWKLDEDSSKCKNFLVTLNTTILLTCNFILGLSELIKLKSAPDLQSIASGIGSFWLHFIGFLKWLYFVCQVRKVMGLVKQLEECYKLSLRIDESDESFSQLWKEMSTAQRSSLRFTWVWCLLVNYGVTHWCLNPVFFKWSLSKTNTTLVGNERLLPYETWIPWDMRGTSGYMCAYALEFLGSLSSGIGSVSYDVFYLTLVMIICAQLRYLNYSLTNDRENDSIESFRILKIKQRLTSSFLQRKLIRGKIHHEAILTFLASFERVTSPVMFVQCIGTIGILCLVSFEATTVKLKGDMNNLIKVWSLLEYIISCFTQLFCFCFYANEVTTLGLQIGDSVYNCGWESVTSEEKNFAGTNTIEKYKKGLGFLMREIITKAQRPVWLTGGPFYVLSLQTFRALVGAAFSYLTVLRGLGEN